MSKVLYIKANPKSTENSITFQMSEAFLSGYKKANPSDEIVTLDLYKEDIGFIDEDLLRDMFTKKDTIVHKYSKQFASADKYIIAAPFWNLSMPAILKAYIDYIIVSGVTFQYTDKGPEGLLKDKKAAYIVARGGIYTEGPLAEIEDGERYLKIVLKFMGITDVSTYCCESTEVLQGDFLKKEIDAAVKNAIEAGQKF